MAADDFRIFLNSLPKDQQTIRIFDLNDGYCLYGNNVPEIAQMVFSTTAIVEDDGNGIKSLHLNQGRFEKLLKSCLVETSTYKIELYTEQEGKWMLSKSGLAGMMEQFSEELGRNGDIVDVLAVMTLGFQSGQRTVAITCLNLAKREIGVCQFADDAEYKNLEVLFLQLGIKECIIQKMADKDTSNELEKVKSLSQRCHIAILEVPRTEFKTTHLDVDLAKICPLSCIEQNRSLLRSPLCRSVLAALIKNPSLMSIASKHQQFKLKEQRLNQFVRLDSSAQKAINVFPSYPGEPAFHSLYGLMNRCITVSGKRLLKSYLKQPLTDLVEIGQRLNVVEVFTNDCLLRDQFQRCLRGMSDVAGLLRKLERLRTHLPDLCHLYKFSITVPVISEILHQRVSGPHQSLFQSRYIEPLELLHNDEHLRRFEQLIEAAIDVARLPDEYFIDPKYDTQLKVLVSSFDSLSNSSFFQKLSSEKQETENKLVVCASKICKELGLEWNKTIKLDWHKANNTQRRCLRITLKEERLVRKKLEAKFVILETLKDGVKFANYEFMELSEELQDLTNSYEETQQKLVFSLTEVSASFVEVFEDALSLVSELDVLCSFACVSVSAPISYTRPRLVDPDSSSLLIKGGRHPLLEVQDGVDFVKNDCCLVYGESWFQIITGPNMGGKSTFIRQIGMIVLMAQIGCFVPCDEAVIPIRDCIFARVGSADYQQRGISTFMSEMLETASFIHGATNHSLIIVDELGRGTSTCDGLGIAWGISEHLIHEIRAPCLFATHFHELTRIQGPVGVKNLHVEAVIDQSSKKVAMLYQVRDGVCDESFGVNVAELVQFPKSVLYNAHKTLKLIEGSDESQETVKNDLQIKAMTDEVEKVLYSETAPVEQLETLKKLLGPLEEILSLHNSPQ